MGESYTTEHDRVSAILYWQNHILDEMPVQDMLKIKWARQAIHGIMIDLAVMYRENDPEFDFVRFLRESKTGAK